MSSSVTERVRGSLASTSQKGSPVTDLPVVDQTDRLIAASLQVNGRASWGQVARVLGITERTAARRGQRLLDDHIVRVSVSIDATRVAHARPMLLRLTTESESLWPVARLLASRPDASSVSVLEGGNQIAGLLLLRDQDAIRRFLFEELAAMPGVRLTNATTVLKFFRTGYDWHPGLLDDDHVRQLRSTLITPSAEGDTRAALALTPDEEAIVAALGEDGRTPISTLATRLSLAPATVKKRLDSLLERGYVHVRTEVLPEVFGLGLEVLLWLRAPVGEIDRIGRRLSLMPEVKFCAASTGTSPILANLLVKDEAALYELLTGEVFAGLSQLEVVDHLVVVTPVLRGSLRVDDGPPLRLAVPSET